jgi:hypothetical protein
MLKTLLTSCVHANLSLLVPADNAMRPACPSRVKTGRPDKRQLHRNPEEGVPGGPGHQYAISRPISTATLPPAFSPPPNYLVR